MRRSIVSLVLMGVLSFLFLLPLKAHAKEVSVSDASAVIEVKTEKVDFRSTADYRLKKMVITRVLERYNSPMIESVDSFVDACYAYNLDCYLVPAIAGLESSFGRRIAPNTNNPFGWGGGHLVFESWNEAIHTVSAGLRERYIGRGATTVAQIGRIYAPPSATWAGNVKKLMSTFQKEEAKVSGLFEIL